MEFNQGSLLNIQQHHEIPRSNLKSLPHFTSQHQVGMCKIMVNQTIALSGSEKLANQGYVNLTHNFKLVMDFIS